MNTVPSVTVIGAGNIGSAVAQIALKAGASVQVLTRDAAKAAAVSPQVSAGTIGEPVLGDIVVLALPYPAFGAVLAAYPAGLPGKVVVDPSNPINFSTGDIVIDPVGSSAAAELAEKLAGAKVLKAFNTNFAATLASGTTGGVTTAVLVAGDDADAKATVTHLLDQFGFDTVDAGPLAEGWRIQRDTPGYGPRRTSEELKRDLAAAKRYRDM